MDQLIKNYLNPRHPGSFGGIERLRRATGSDKDEVLKALQTTDVYTISKENRQKFQRNPIVVTNLQQQYQMDLADVSKYQAQKDGTNHLLVAIDCFSRKISVQPVKFKGAVHIEPAMLTVFKELGIPDKVQVDKGKEFYNGTVNGLMKQNEVRMFSSENDDIKCSMVERIIRTLKERIWRYLRHIQATRYIDRLQDFVHSYNRTIHSAHGRKPVDVKHTNSLAVFPHFIQKASQ